jgi:hypothetical protein
MNTAGAFAQKFSHIFEFLHDRVRSAWGTRIGAWAAVLVLFALALPSSGCKIGGQLSDSVPEIAGITPNPITAGGPAQQVTITGMGFNSAVPTANGTPLAVVSVTPTQIVAVVPASVIAVPGTIIFLVVDVLPSGNVSSNMMTVPVMGAASTPDLTITKMHAGNFTQGQVGATYTITVSNVGSGPTRGTVDMMEQPPPSGLTITAMSGTGWVCVVTMLSCTRSDVLTGGMSYQPITVTVTVAANAPGSVTNSATVSGGGDTTPANNTANDMTTINPAAGPPVFGLGVTTTSVTFPKAGTAGYLITVTNTGMTSTNGTTVTLTITLDASLTQGSLSGAGWTCNLGADSCTITVVLAPGNSYAVITLDVVVSPGAPANVTSVFMVSGGGAATVIVTKMNPTM